MAFESGKSYLVAGPLPPAALTSFLPVDRLMIDGNEAGVKEVRHILAQATQRPHGHQRLLLVRSAEALSDVIQNTLLKTLEEPPSQLVVIIEAVDSIRLLPTVRSRLHPLSFVAEAACPPPARPYPTTPTELQNLLEQAKGRPELDQTLAALLSGATERALVEPTAGTLANILLVERALLRFRHSANQKIVVDGLLLHWYCR